MENLKKLAEGMNHRFPEWYEGFATWRWNK